ncbi:hypothetical protein [Sporomusa sp.]|uniref:SWIM zinc finger family protein n=1 Tax=Sporomusa sp. TaxID=2078658 RepID=UPI002BDBCC42|nr:hypothetical protein [Sporomusa sp.]HWR45813.1 hypothetical protein [Sporomusa sp.]
MTTGWTKALASCGLDSRLRRGRAYAHQGHVMDIKIGKGLIEARVQGSRPKPYRVNIRLKPFTLAQWNIIIESLASQAGFAAKLLAGEMPETGRFFSSSRLFPLSSDSGRSSCRMFLP